MSDHLPPTPLQLYLHRKPYCWQNGKLMEVFSEEKANYQQITLGLYYFPPSSCNSTLHLSLRPYGRGLSGPQLLLLHQPVSLWRIKELFDLIAITEDLTSQYFNI